MIKIYVAVVFCEYYTVIIVIITVDLLQSTKREGVFNQRVNDGSNYFSLFLKNSVCSYSEYV